MILCVWFAAALLLVSDRPSMVLADSPRPNIVFIVADDLGYGDLGCYGATRVQTPSVDRLARDGLLFSDGHSTSATCTPSRYGLLTGQYPWRTPGTNILAGNAGLIIPTDRPSLASMLRQEGYDTAVVGKWHLGLGKGPESLDWNSVIAPGPRDVGFDYSFLIPATGDRVPCVYVENHRVLGLDPADPLQVSYRGPLDALPTGKDHPELLKMKPSHGHDQTIINGISRIGYMAGAESAWWVDEDMADVITSKAVSFIEKKRSKPFFLYFATHDIHVPRVPHARFVGSTKMGPRGDVIAEFDWCVNQLLESLHKQGIEQNTLVILTSDNGPVVDDGYQDQAVERLGDHRPAGPLRGGKYSLFEGGTRVPFIVRWPGRVKPGSSDALICQVDLFASLAALLNHKLNDAEAPDSQNLLPALLGDSPQGRHTLVHQAGGLALRQDSWKFIPPGKGAKVNQNTKTEMGTDTSGQLYDLSLDLAERNNLAPTQTQRAQEMAAILKSIQAGDTQQKPEPR